MGKNILEVLSSTPPRTHSFAPQRCIIPLGPKFGSELPVFCFCYPRDPPSPPSPRHRRLPRPLPSYGPSLLRSELRGM